MKLAILVSLSKDAFEQRTSTGSGLFSFWTVVLPNFWTNRLYDSKDTLKYKFGIVKVLENENELTSGWRALPKIAFA